MDPIPFPFPADKLVSEDKLQIGKYYYFEDNPEYPNVFSGRYVSKGPAQNSPGTQKLKWDKVQHYQMILDGDQHRVGQQYRVLPRGYSTFIPTNARYIPAVDRQLKTDLKSQARDLSSGEVAGILRSRDKTKGLAPEGSAFDRAMATGILPGQVGQFLTSDDNIIKGSKGEVKQSLRNIGDKVRALPKGGRTKKSNRRARKTRRSRK
jgi:hypothetical protein